jgi:nucleoid-associated protein YgaU
VRPNLRLGAILSFLVEDIAFRLAIAAMLAVAVIAAAVFVDTDGDTLPTPPPAATVGAGTAPSTVAPPVASTAPPTQAGPAATTHTVAPGESLYGLAARYYGDGSMWRTIYEANAAAIADPDRLPVGVTLTIPDR